MGRGDTPLFTMPKTVDYPSFSNLKILQYGDFSMNPNLPPMKFEVFEVTDEDKEKGTFEGIVLGEFPTEALAKAFADGVNYMARQAFKTMLKNVRGDRSDDDRETTTVEVDDGKEG